MGGRSDDQHASGDKTPRPEPNLELPSFRLRRKKKPAEPSLLTPEPSALTPEPSLLTPEPSRLTPEPSLLPPEPSVDRVPEAPHRLAPPPPPPAPVRKAPPPPSSATAHIPPPPPQPKAPPRPSAPPTPAPAIDELPEPAKARKEPKPPKPAKEPKPPKAPKPKRERSSAPPRWLPGYAAAIITGALCGVLTVLLAWATGQGCAQLRGVGTCGGYGVFALVAILGIDVVIATSLLRLCRVVDPATTALLGVGLVAVLAMLFFLGQTQSFAMVYVIPILMAVTFAFAWWITRAIAQRVDDN